MMVAESLVELILRRDRFESSKPNGKGNGRGDHEEDKEGHSNDGNDSSNDDGNGKQRNKKWKPNNLKEKRKIRCYLCKGSHMKKDYLKASLFSAIKRNDEPEVTKLVGKKISMINSMVLIPKKRDGREGLMFVDINIAGHKKSALIDMGASNLFMSENAARKLGLSIKKLNKKIKTVNSKEGPTVGVAQNMELQIGKQKGKEEFEVIQLDNYDFVLGLNFLDKIQAGLYLWADQIHIVTGLLSRIIVSVYRDMKVAIKVLSSIQLVDDVSYGRNIDSIEWNATKAPSEVLVAQEIDKKPVESTIKLTPLGKIVRALSKFLSEDADGLWAIRSQGVRIKGIPKRASKNWGQVRVETSCQRDVPINAMVQVKRRWKLRQRF
ncbi:hypothetical protein Gotur_009256 [Gossypium turneri]